MRTSRILFSILFIGTINFLSCKSNNSKTVDVDELLKEKSYEGENVGSPLDVFVSNFLKKHPDIENNDVTFENARKDFAKDFDEELKSGFLNDMTFSCLSVTETLLQKNYQLLLVLEQR